MSLTFTTKFCMIVYTKKVNSVLGSKSSDNRDRAESRDFFMYGGFHDLADEQAKFNIRPEIFRKLCFSITLNRTYMNILMGCIPVIKDINRCSVKNRDRN